MDAEGINNPPISGQRFRQGGEGDREANSSFSIVPPSLSKGGGALTGIGQSFTAQLATGTGSISIPVHFSPGRNGFGPSLSLTYSSGAGNGPFGFGVLADLPSIERSSRTVPRYGAGPEEDRFHLWSGEDLVPVLHQDGQPLVRTDLRNPFDPGARFAVFQYRHRRGPPNIRIERWEPVDGRAPHWRTISGDNVTSLYGISDEGRLADPDSPHRIFRWHVELSWDDRGNVVSYGYKSEDLDGVDANISERHRVEGRVRVSGRYIKRIRYGNSMPFPAPAILGSQTDLSSDLIGWRAANRWLFEAVFDYGDHDIAQPRAAPDRGWPVRPDAFSSYRGGFELRTWRLCRRVLMFHRFTEDGKEDLVRTTKLTHATEEAGSFLVGVEQIGHHGDVSSALPPLRLEYTMPGAPGPLELATRSRKTEELDRPLAPPGDQRGLIDLFGEGISGMLTRRQTVWEYQRGEGDGHFGLPVEVVRTPALAGTDSWELSDINADGRLEVVLAQGPLSGAWVPGADGEPATYYAFRNNPTRSQAGPEVLRIDLTGDGKPDLLVSEDECFAWHNSLGLDGYAAAERVARALDEEDGPRAVTVDDSQSIYVADMSGDGLTDLVRIRNGEVSYWPNLGHGRFGARVAMRNAPRFAKADAFDPQRLRLGDIDGGGTSDLLYLGKGTTSFWMNHSGNGFAKAVTIDTLPPMGRHDQIELVDLLGEGMACLVWSRIGVDGRPAPVRYLRLMGSGKPYLLSKIDNNLGAVTEIAYVPSTRHYLADRRAGRPWPTLLPFPIHVVERVITSDLISGARFVTNYTYHDGHYDREEREFAGFAFVESTDRETYEPETPHDGAVPDPDTVLTRSWFDVGATSDRGALQAQHLEDAYSGDPDFWRIDSPEIPTGLDEDGLSEAYRSLRGQLLREEVFSIAPDGTLSNPFVVTEHRHLVRHEQARHGWSNGVFAAFSIETLTHHYERNPSDPRVAQDLILEIGAYGEALRKVAATYPRRGNILVSEQQQRVLIEVKSDVRAVDGEDHSLRLGLAVESTIHQLLDLDLPPDSERLQADQLQKALSVPGLGTVDNVEEGSGRPRRHRLSTTRTIWRGDDLGPLPFGDVHRLALPWEAHTLALSPSTLEAAGLSAVAQRELLTSAGYRQLNDRGEWWTPSGRLIIPGESGDGAAAALTNFFQPLGNSDIFENSATVRWDRWWLFPVEVTDSFGSTVIAEHDYRILQPRRITDSNGHMGLAAFDPLGMVVAIAEVGRDGEGDSLEAPTERFVYNFDAFRRWRERAEANPATTSAPVPVWARTERREYHELPEADVGWQVTIAYSDGFGRVVQSKTQAEEGLAPEYDREGRLVLDATGQPVLANTTDRTIGTGATVYNKKGMPIRQYESFFDKGFAFRAEQVLTHVGPAATQHYDPIGRPVRVDFADGTRQRVEQGPWEVHSFDKNDWSVGSTWATSARSDIADAAAAHADTPTIDVCDSLGRVTVAVAQNRDEGAADVFIPSHSVLDLQGRQLEIWDGRGAAAPTLQQALRRRGNRVMAFKYSLNGMLLRQDSMDAGPRWMLPDAQGEPYIVWDGTRRDDDTQAAVIPQDARRLRVLRDALRRPLEERLLADPDGEVTVRRFIWGEMLPPDEARSSNLIGRNFRTYDQSGLSETTRYDFGGRPIERRRRLVASHAITDGPVDWSEPDFEERLESETFVERSTYDALGRVVRVAAWHREKDAGVPLATIYVPSYNRRGSLESETLHLDSPWTPDGALGGRSVEAVSQIVEDANGRRELLRLGNGTTTRYDYDPQSRRLRQLRTTTPGHDPPFPSPPGDPGDPRVLQNLFYAYDAVGNPVEVLDRAFEPAFFRNQSVLALSRYKYDALYRLVGAKGRESAALGPLQTEMREPVGRAPPVENEGALRDYTERYAYDEAGNLTELHHRASDGNWTRYSTYATDSNRLETTRIGSGGTPVRHRHDPHGNLLNVSASDPADDFVWDWRDLLTHADLGGGGVAHYTYAADRTRVRKRITRSNGRGNGIVEERIYLGGVELFRRWNGDQLEEEIETHHLMIGEERALIVDTVRKTANATLGTGVLFRYQYSNNLGSAVLELDESVRTISFEEYHPYGTTSHALRNPRVRQTAKRYRYTGMERDEETGLSLHGARYYDPRLARWTSADPAGAAGGVNLYCYSLTSPLKLADTTGLQPDLPREQASDGFPMSEAEVRRRLSEAGVDDPEEIEVVLARWRTEVVPRLESDIFREEIAAGGERFWNFLIAGIGIGTLVGVGPYAIAWALSNPIEAFVFAGGLGIGAVDPHPPGASPWDAPGLDPTDITRSLRQVGAGSSFLRRIGPEVAGSGQRALRQLRHIDEVQDLPTITFRVSEAMASDPTDAVSLRFILEWLNESGPLVVSSRPVGDQAIRSALRAELRAANESLPGFDSLGRLHLAHIIDSAAAGSLEGGGRTVYYLSLDRVNLSYGGQLGAGIQRLGLEPGDQFQIAFDATWDALDNVRPTFYQRLMWGPD